jgi:capsular polysaccharide transport system permease protein
MSFASYQRLSLARTLEAQWRIILALMLRDVRTRFFGSAIGFIFAAGWPLANIFILVVFNSALGRAAPYGTSATLWFATGLVPFMAFQYMARFTMLGLVLNRPLLGLPVVKVMDIMLARGLLEVLNAGLVAILSMLILFAMGVPFMPSDTVQAFWAMAASMLLGLGFGLINGIIAGFYLGWVTGYGLVSILLWVASGILFVPDSLPEKARYWLSFNPALQGVEWMRSAYYPGFGATVLDKTYMLCCAAGAIFLGLLLERLARERLLQ